MASVLRNFKNIFSRPLFTVRSKNFNLIQIFHFVGKRDGWISHILFVKRGNIKSAPLVWVSQKTFWKVKFGNVQPLKQLCFNFSRKEMKINQLHMYLEKKSRMHNFWHFHFSSYKGQLISEWFFDVFKSPKKGTFFWQIFALASKMGQMKKLEVILDKK